LNLGSGQNQSGFVLVNDDVVVPGLAVFGNELDGAFFHPGGVFQDGMSRR
jgi:hypothetical protein